MIKVCNRIIEYSFYFLFLLVPLAFTDKTSELFELNKMWLVWLLTIIVAMVWFTKMIPQRRILFQRTPLDIPIALFLLSQIISTIFSLDSHVSFWGYYSRFNGGLLSMLSYVFLYYAFLSNFSAGDTTGRAPDSAHLSKAEGALAGGKVGAGPARMVKRLLSISLISGLFVALWGLPSHFGYDPTCFIFRGTLDVSCWTQDFMPKIRIFSTLGQPDWLAAYLAILIPIAIAYILQKWKMENGKWKIWMYLSLLVLFYVDILYTRARSGIIGVWLSLIFFFTAYIWIQRKNLKLSTINHKLLTIIGIFLLITFIIGTPINQIRMLTLEGLGSAFKKPANTEGLRRTETQSESGGPAPRSSALQNEGGTESGLIRLLVWEGAINAWKANPIFGTGVETFAFAYYKYKPAEHNLTSEWNFLYNKTHNEYLNYLATTGIFGIGTYLIMIITFLCLVLTKITNSFANFANRLANVREKYEMIAPQDNMLILVLLSGYISILVTNFFGFSVVITNIYLFMIPAFIFVLSGMIKPISVQSAKSSAEIKTSLYQWTFIFLIILTSLFMIYSLFRFWLADIHYALGYNLDRAGEYQKGYESLHKAVILRGDEPVFKDELSINDAIIAAGLLAQEPAEDQKERTISVASALIQEAINTSNEIISKSPNNAVFWKTRVRLFHTLSQVDSRYLPRALDGIQKASLIAPNDANIWYNLGVLYGQSNNIAKGIEALEKTVKLRPNYRDAHYALGLFYRQAAIDKDGNVIDESLNKKGIAQMQYILDRFSSYDPGALESIENWVK